VYDIVSKQLELGPDEERQKLGEQERQWAAKCLLPVFKLLQYNCVPWAKETSCVPAAAGHLSIDYAPKV
jgi:hypothetical protein